MLTSDIYKVAKENNISERIADSLSGVFIPLNGDYSIGSIRKGVKYWLGDYNAETLHKVSDLCTACIASYTEEHIGKMSNVRDCIGEILSKK